jgi:DNA-directed RNA polymerase specialized sigma24 family protein
MIVRNEARRLVTRRRTVPVAEGWETRPADTPPAAAGMIASEQAVALRSAFARLGDDCRQMLTLMLADPPLSYDEIAAALDRPRGSLGPSRQRCLEHLRRLLPAGLEIGE